jgi:transcriptional regulator with XRE-family HTH domain
MTVTDFSRDLGRRLRAERMSRSLSLGDVQAMSGGRLKPATVASWEYGVRAMGVERLAELAGLYGVSTASLVPALAP